MNQSFTVILRKRQVGELPQGPAWKAAEEISNSIGETIPVNEYFAKRPQMMLGEMRLERRMYQRNEPTLVDNGKDLADQLTEVIAAFPKAVFEPLQERVTTPPLEQVFHAPEDEDIKPNAYAVINDQIGIRKDDQSHRDLPPLSTGSTNAFEPLQSISRNFHERPANDSTSVLSPCAAKLPRSGAQPERVFRPCRCLVFGRARMGSASGIPPLSRRRVLAGFCRLAK